jgi:hypothetical protein
MVEGRRRPDMKFDTIYRFKWLNDAGDYVTSRRMATLQGVEKLRGVIIGGSGIKIPASEIDENGFTRREFDLATIDLD